VLSVVKTDHKAVVAMSNGIFMPDAKTKQQCTFRRKTPSQNASFLRHLSEMDGPGNSTGRRSTQLARTHDPQAFYDEFYSFALGLLDDHYLELTIIVTSRDQSYVTADIKAKLRRKNRLMRAGRVEEAGALARQIGRDITRHRKHQLEQVGIKPNAKELWKTVRQLTGREHEPAGDPNVTACPAIGDHERADNIRAVCVEISRCQQRRSATRVPGHRHRAVDVRRQRVARPHQNV